MNITHGKTIHLVGMASPKKLNYKAQLSQPSSYTNSNRWSSHELTSQVSTKPDSLRPSPSIPALPIRSEKDTCPAGVKPFLTKFIFHHFSCDIKLMWHNINLGKLQLVVLPFFSNPFRPRTKGSHNQAMKASGTTWNQLIILPKMCTFWFMDKAHEPKWVSLGKCGLESTKGIPTEFPA